MDNLQLKLEHSTCLQRAFVLLPRALQHWFTGLPWKGMPTTLCAHVSIHLISSCGAITNAWDEHSMAPLRPAKALRTQRTISPVTKLHRWHTASLSSEQELVIYSEPSWSRLSVNKVKWTGRQPSLASVSLALELANSGWFHWILYIPCLFDSLMLWQLSKYGQTVFQFFW